VWHGILTPSLCQRGGAEPPRNLPLLEETRRYSDPSSFSFFFSFRHLLIHQGRRRWVLTSELIEQLLHLHVVPPPPPNTSSNHVVAPPLAIRALIPFPVLLHLSKTRPRVPGIWSSWALWKSDWETSVLPSLSLFFPCRVFPRTHSFSRYGPSTVLRGFFISMGIRSPPCCVFPCHPPSFTFPESVS